MPAIVEPRRQDRYKIVISRRGDIPHLEAGHAGQELMLNEAGGSFRNVHRKN
jgi:hypothetical protein